MAGFYKTVGNISYPDNLYDSSRHTSEVDPGEISAYRIRSWRQKRGHRLSRFRNVATIVRKWKLTWQANGWEAWTPTLTSAVVRALRFAWLPVALSHWSFPSCNLWHCLPGPNQAGPRLAQASPGLCVGQPWPAQKPSQIIQAKPAQPRPSQAGSTKGPLPELFSFLVWSSHPPGFCFDLVRRGHRRCCTGGYYLPPRVGVACLLVEWTSFRWRWIASVSAASQRGRLLATRYSGER